VCFQLIHLKGSVLLGH